MQCIRNIYLVRIHGSERIGSPQSSNAQAVAQKYHSQIIKICPAARRAMRRYDPNGSYICKEAFTHADAKQLIEDGIEYAMDK
jgi:hypothetical protein